MSADQNESNGATFDDSREIDFLYDLSLKRYDYLVKAFDTVNTRVGLVFGFSGLVIANGASAFKEMKVQAFPLLAMAPLGFVVLVVFLALSYHCWMAYSVRSVQLLPNARLVYEDWISRENRDLVDIKRNLICNQIDKIVNPSYIDAIKIKTHHLNRALFLTVAEVGLILLISCLPHMPAWSTAMSKETTKPSESKTPADMSPQAGPPAALPDAGARPRPPLDMFVGPGFSEAVGMGRSRRDIKSPERFRSAVTLERPRKP